PQGGGGPAAGGLGVVGRHDGAMLLAPVVAASQAVAATRSRRVKVAELATLLREAEPDERAAVVAFLSGRLTQGRLGVGWRTLTSLDSSPADAAQLAAPE